MTTDQPPPGHWADGPIPGNVRIGPGSIINGGHAFKRFHSEIVPALEIGAHCTLDGVHFALGPRGHVRIGDFCCFTTVILLSELEVLIGNHVLIGWNATIADTDFHPLAPAMRIADAIACSPLGKGTNRPAVPCRPVRIGNDVWIGPNATILKGVTIGDGAFIEPGALITRDVPPRARMLGNPARMVGEV